MIDNYDDMKKIPIVDMTIGDVVDFFEIIYARKHGGDEDVRRSVSEARARFMAEALYKYYNHKEPDSKTSNAPAREEKENWDETVDGPLAFYTQDARMAIVRELTDIFKNDLIEKKTLFQNNKIFSFKTVLHPNCELSIYIKDNNLVISYYIGGTTYTHTVPFDPCDFTEKSKTFFWSKYAEIIVSLSNELVAQIKEGH